MIILWNCSDSRAHLSHPVSRIHLPPKKKISENNNLNDMLQNKKIQIACF